MSERSDTERLAYQEYHYQNVKDVGIAFDGIRVWVCINGVAALRAKRMKDQLFVEFYPEQIDAALDTEEPPK